jgi:hypothetical protein
MIVYSQKGKLTDKFSWHWPITDVFSNEETIYFRFRNKPYGMKSWQLAKRQLA